MFPYTPLADTLQNPRLSPAVWSPPSTSGWCFRAQWRHVLWKMHNHFLPANIFLLQQIQPGSSTPGWETRKRRGKNHKKSVRFLLINLSLRKSQVWSAPCLLMALGLKFIQSTATLGSLWVLVVTQKRNFYLFPRFNSGLCSLSSWIVCADSQMNLFSYKTQLLWSPSAQSACTVTISNQLQLGDTLNQPWWIQMFSSLLVLF